MVQKSEPTSWYIGGGLSPHYLLGFMTIQNGGLFRISEPSRGMNRQINTQVAPTFRPPFFRSSNWKAIRCNAAEHHSAAAWALEWLVQL